MLAYEQAYIELLRSALWYQKPSLSDKPDWRKVMELATGQATVALVCQSALRIDSLQAPPEAYCEKMKHIILRNMSSHEVINEVLSLVVTALQSHSIEPVLLKGQGQASNYPIPSLRHCGDIDLYVSPDSFAKACSIVGELAGESFSEKAHTTELHYHVRVKGIVVEIHHHTAVMFYPELETFYQYFAQDGLSGNLPQLSIGDVKVKLPSNDFNAIYVFYHLWHHFMGLGVGFRQLCDWTMFLHANIENLDMENLGNNLKTLRLLEAWKVFGYVAVDALGLPSEEMPFFDPKVKKRASRLERIILSEGNFGRHSIFRRNRKKQTKTHRKLSTFARIHVRTWQLFGIFPKMAFVWYFRNLKSMMEKIV